MVVIDRAFKGAAVATTVVGVMTPGAPGIGGTFTVANDAGYPTVGKFEVVIDRGLSSEEKILVNSRAGAVFTVALRGYDDTTAVGHTAVTATCEHNLSARTVQLFTDHVDDVEADPHSTKLLNNARHDITARHAFGAALGTPGTPTALTPDIAGAAGVGAVPARSDHAHNVPAAVPVAVGTALAEGAGSSFARDNHVHTIGAGAINAHSMLATPVFAYYSQAADPGAVGAGRLWYETDTLTLWVRNAADNGWLMIFRTGDGNWQVFSPAFNGFTAGTGGVQYGRYTRVGQSIFGNAGFVIGTGGNQVGTVGFTAPVPGANISANHRWLSGARSFHTPSGARFSGLGFMNASSDPNLFSSFATAGTSATWDTNTPENWDVGHEFHCFFEYEAA